MAKVIAAIFHVTMRQHHWAGSMRYQVYGLLLTSEMALPELTSAAETEPKGWADLRVRFGEARRSISLACAPVLSRTLPNGRAVAVHGQKRVGLPPAVPGTG